MSTEVLADERASRASSAPVLGMVLFVASESMFFAAFLAIYALNLSSHPVWPPKGVPAPSMLLPTAMTAAMVVSSILIHLALRAIRGGRTRPFSRLLAITLVLGLVFVALQLGTLPGVGFGIRDGPYGSLFYVMTGVALAHVIGGIVLLGMVLARTVSGRLSMVRHEPAEAATIYWHFVVVMTVVLYVAFYVVASTHVKGP
jgi:heme/copper-type cytochrome/quinol oxidase subunit 3